MEPVGDYIVSRMAIKVPAEPLLRGVDIKGLVKMSTDMEKEPQSLSHCEISFSQALLED